MKNCVKKIFYFGANSKILYEQFNGKKIADLDFKKNLCLQLLEKYKRLDYIEYKNDKYEKHYIPDIYKNK